MLIDIIDQSFLSVKYCHSGIYLSITLDHSFVEFSRSRRKSTLFSQVCFWKNRSSFQAYHISRSAKSSRARAKNSVLYAAQKTNLRDLLGVVSFEIGFFHRKRKYTHSLKKKIRIVLVCVYNNRRS